MGHRSVADMLKLVRSIVSVLARRFRSRAVAPPRKPDAALLKATARAHRWFEELVSGRATSLAAIASRQGVTATLPA